MDNAGHVSFNANNTGVSGTATASSTGVLGLLDEDLATWQQVVITRGATSAAGGSGAVNIYINGAAAGAGTVDADINGTAEYLWAGKRAPSSPSRLGAYNGKLDEIRIYHGREFAAWEAAELYNTENPTSSAGSASIKVNFSSDDASILDDSVRLELFSNGFTEPATGLPITPFYDQDYNASGSSLFYRFNSNANGNAWQDYQGAWRITALAGSVLVDSVEITINGSTFVYQGTITPSRVGASYAYEKIVELNRDRTFGMVVKYSQAIPSYTFAHEIGHLLGAHHALGDNALMDNDPQVTFNPYGTEEQTTISGIDFTRGTGQSVRDEFVSMGNHFLGFSSGNNSWGRYATIMADDTSWKRIPRFSSPSLFWQGGSTGENHGRMLPPPLSNFSLPLYNDNVRSIVLIGNMAAKYRDEIGTFRHDNSTSTWTFPINVPVGIPDSGGSADPTPQVNPAMTQSDSRGARAQASSSGRGGSTTRSPVSGARSGTTVAGSTTRSTKGIGVSARPSPSTPSNPPATTQPGGSTPLNPAATLKSGNAPPVTAKPLPGGVSGRSPIKPGNGNPGVAVPNDLRKRSQPVPLRVLADRSYFATVNGHNRGATGREDAAWRTDDSQATFHGRSVWWHVVAPADGDFELQADTHGSAIDTTLAVWLPGEARPLANDNDSLQPGPASAVRVRRFTLRKRDRIVLAVDGVNGAQGLLRLNVRLKPVQ